jgi:3-methyladenine DNA glycosylase AlkD
VKREVATSESVARAAARAIRELKAEARPPGEFDPSRYFRTTEPLAFLNVRTPIVRKLAREIAREHRATWTIEDAVAFTDRLIREAYLEAKGLGIEALGMRRREIGPRWLGTFKRWLADAHASNWATTDALCGTLISPLLLADPALVRSVASWVDHRSLWVRRAAAVSLVRLAARGLELDTAFAVATALRIDRADLIQKAAGWLLREAGRTDPERLERYLIANGPAIPRTTIRYAIERFPNAKRSALLAATKRPRR